MAKAMISDASVITAVGFLDDVCRKHWDEADLRRYLVGRQGLSTNQVTQAFRIHRSRSSSFRKEANGKNLLEMEMCPTVESPSIETFGKMESQSIELSQKMEMSPSLAKSTSPSFIQLGSGDRPERMLIKPPEKISKPLARKSKLEIASSISFLQPSKREDGEKLIHDFLACEKVYCIVLECLEEYHKELSWYARQGSTNVKLEEVKKMFQQIPQLHNFHKSFYADVLVGGNLGRLFLRRMSFFKGYGKYLKDATFTIERLRDHISDMKLINFLAEVRQRSSLTRNDLADLVITPINRIMDYEAFVVKLCEWADKARVEDYQYFAKAARRIGRVAKYIDSYRHGIINRCEMNRVQQYLGKQVKIIHPNRSIIRRGMLTRRMSGWTARRKKYHFFLFSDVLIWTTKNGVLQNVVELLYCQVQPWHSKRDSHKKFKIVVDMRSKTWTKQNSKTILIECKSKGTKRAWYRSIENTIKLAKKKTSDIPEKIISINVMNDSDDETFESFESDKPNVVLAVPNVSNISQTFPDSHILRTIKQKESLSFEERTPTETSSVDIPTEGVYHDRYESHNFIDQQFKEIYPMDDSDSQTSEYDQSFFEKYGTYQDKGNNISFLSPHQKFPPPVMNQKDEKVAVESKEEDRNGFTIHHRRKDSCVIKRRRSSFSREYLPGFNGNDNYMSGFVISLEDLDLGTEKIVL